MPGNDERNTHARAAQRRYIDRLRTMNPDEVLAERLDRMEEELDDQECTTTGAAEVPGERRQ